MTLPQLDITHYQNANDSDSKRVRVTTPMRPNCAKVALARARALPTADMSRDSNGSRVLFHVVGNESTWNRDNAPYGAIVLTHIVGNQENGSVSWLRKR